jgi:hypothetical protein
VAVGDRRCPLLASRRAGPMTCPTFSRAGERSSDNG